MAADQAQQPPHVEYYYALYQMDTPPRTERAEAELRDRAAAGWRVHTTSMEGGIYLQVLWERTAPAPPAPPPGKRAPGA
jgi:hypothetical protein